jgi:hypothetical protein
MQIARPPIKDNHRPDGGSLDPPTEGYAKHAVFVRTRTLLPLIGRLDPRQITPATVANLGATLEFKPSSPRRYIATLAAIRDYADVDPIPAKDKHAKLPREERRPASRHLRTLPGGVAFARRRSPRQRWQADGGVSRISCRRPAVLSTWRSGPLADRPAIGSYGATPPPRLRVSEHQEVGCEATRLSSPVRRLRLVRRPRVRSARRQRVGRTGNHALR